MIFTGIELLFFVLGALVTVAIYTLIHYNRRYKFKLGTLSIIIFGVLLLIFGLAWALSSYIEGVPRAASMGLVFFCTPALILLLVGRRMALKRK